MKEQIKLLAEIEIDGVKYAKGQVLRCDKDTAADLIEKGVAEAHTEKDAGEDIEKRIKSALESQVKELDIDSKVKEAVASTIKTEEQHDPSWGYGAPVVAGKERSKGAKIHAAAEFFKDVKASADGRTPERLEKAMQLGAKAAGTPGQTIAVDDEGGYAVPTETRILLDGATIESALVRPQATVVPMSTKSIERTRVQDYDHSGGYVAGAAIAYWEGENATQTSSKIKFEKSKLDLNKLTALGYMSHEMLKFSTVSGGLLVQELGKAIAFAEDGAFLTDGTGAGQPQAIMKANAKIQVTRDTASSIVLADILGMLARLRVKSRSAVKWICNQTCLPQLAQLNLAVGTGGAPVWIPNNDARQGIPGFLYGYPVQFSEYPEALGTAGDIILGDFSQYEIGDFVEGPDVAESMHVKFLEAQTAYRIIKYVDGQVGPKNVFTPKHGDTLAPFVHLS